MSINGVRFLHQICNHFHKFLQDFSKFYAFIQKREFSGQWLDLACWYSGKCVCLSPGRPQIDPSLNPFAENCQNFMIIWVYLSYELIRRHIETVHLLWKDRFHWIHEHIHTTEMPWMLVLQSRQTQYWENAKLKSVNPSWNSVMWVNIGLVKVEQPK